MTEGEKIPYGSSRTPTPTTRRRFRTNPTGGRLPPLRNHRKIAAASLPPSDEGGVTAGDGGRENSVRVVEDADPYNPPQILCESHGRQVAAPTKSSQDVHNLATTDRLPFFREAIFCFACATLPKITARNPQKKSSAVLENCRTIRYNSRREVMRFGAYTKNRKEYQ